MSTRSAGRPREFDPEGAVRVAACLFWQYGFAGTSTRMLTAALGVSSSSLYAAFGSKAGLFEQAVRTYALRYHAIYDAAVSEVTFEQVARRLLVDSVHEFTRTQDGHPGCMVNSAVMAEDPATVAVRTQVEQLQHEDLLRLHRRAQRAVDEGDVAATTDPVVLADVLQALWQGLASRADQGGQRHELLAMADLSAALIGAHRPPDPSPPSPAAAPPPGTG